MDNRPVVRRSRHGACCIISVALLSACGPPPTAPNFPTPIEGTYHATAFEGEFPFRIVPGITLEALTLELSAEQDGRARRKAFLHNIWSDRRSVSDMRGTYSVTGYTLYFDWPRSWALVRIDRLIWDHASWRDSSRMLLYGYVKNNTSREYFVVFEHAEGE